MTLDIAVARQKANTSLTLLTASIGCAMTVLDTNVVAVILPTIARDYGASFADVEWVISTYVLCFASLLLPAGAIADRFGRRLVFLIGIGAFALSSWLCGAAPSAAVLYLARAAQGISAALMLAPALAIIGHTFHQEEARNRAWAMWGAIMGLTMVLSPILGGVIAYALGWRWAFYINIPICVALAVAALRLIEESRDINARRLDPFGFVSFSAAMFGITWGLINGQAHGWSSSVALTGFVGGSVALVIFVIAETIQSRPMLDLSLFRNPRFVGGVWAMFAYAACAQVMASMLPLFLQNGLGRTALQAGFAMFPFAIAMLIFPNVGRLLSRQFGSREILSLGLLIVGIGSLLTAWGARDEAWYAVICGMLVLGSGGGLLNGETQKAIMAVVPRERAGMASGISTTSRFSGILLGFAVLSGILASVVRATLIQINCADPTCTSAFAEAIVTGDLPAALAGIAPSARETATAVAMKGYSTGFATALTVSAIMAIVSALMVYGLMHRGKPLPKA
ncbi:MFS transporter [Ochrobactrum quorumnocens]|uniref:MFS transporter n=1 Tax=Ochrobactrum quorumnocens TaxID=271865 RepID=UPI0038520FAB